MLLTNLRLFGQYNQWANGRLYASVATLSDGEYFKDRPSFFGSIHRTLNHILLGDRIWFARIEGGEPITAALDTELYKTLPELGTAREAEDQRIIDYVDGLDEATLAGDLDYANTKGDPFTTPLRLVLQHVFNHQTHHRGQVHDMVSQTEVETPVLDLLYFVR